MPTPRMTMRAIQEVIRLHAAGFSQRQIAQACRLSKGAVGNYLQKAEQASVSWPLPPEMDPAKLEALLFSSHRSATVTAPVIGQELPFVESALSEPLAQECPVQGGHGS